MRSTRNDRAAGHMFLLCGLAYLALALATRETVFITLGPGMIGIGVALLARTGCRA